jgi:hypothetical protein
MTIKTRVALVVTLAVCVAPVAVAHPRTHHAQTSHSGATYGSAYLYGRSDQWPQGPSYAATTIPSYVPYRRWQSVADEGQGRFLPCEMRDG